jgi:hypothetical protein
MHLPMSLTVDSREQHVKRCSLHVTSLGNRRKMKRRQFLSNACLGSMAGLLLTATSSPWAAMPAGRLQPALWRLTAGQATATTDSFAACSWVQAQNGCTAAKPASAWTFRLQAFVPGQETTLTRLDIDANYADGQGGSNAFHLLRYRHDSIGASSKPLSFRTSARSLRGLSLRATHADALECHDAQCALSISDAGDLLPGDYVWLLSAQGINPMDYVHSGDREQPLARRDGAPVEHDYLAFAISESA